MVYWNITNVIRKKRNPIPIFIHNNALYTTNIEKCNIMAQTFASNHDISNQSGDDELELQVRLGTQYFRLTNPNISEDMLITKSQIRDIIKNVKLKKAPGIDGIGNQCLKNIPEKSFKFVTVIFNACLSMEYFPLEFKTAKVVAIQKLNEPPDSLSAYRPINLLSSIGKIFEKIINQKLILFIESNNIILFSK